MRNLTRPRTPQEIAELRKQLASFAFWYHNIDLGDGIWTNPNHPHGDYPASRWKLLEPYVPKDLRGATVLDLGCNAGFYSIEFKRRGASYILGIDEVPEHIDQAHLVARELGWSDIDYRCMSVYDVDKLIDTPGRFDFVVFLGLFYHLRYPLFMLDKISRMQPRKMFFQTMLRGESGNIEIQRDYPIEECDVFTHPRFPAMYFVEHRFANDPTDWWMANDNGIKAMLRSAGFTSFVQLQENPELFVCDAPTHEPGEDA